MPRSKPHLLYIHGGYTFRRKRDYLRMLKMRPVRIDKKISWNADYLDKQLGRLVHIIRPRMPLQDNARYDEWKIHFERFFPLLKNNLILVGQSLGGIFLAKYLSENKFPKKILATYLVCPPFDDTLPTEDLAGGFTLKADLSLLEKNSPRLYLFFSKNDPIVPPSQAEKYAAKLKHAKIFIYKDKNGHFQVPTFPEIVGRIRGELRNQ